MNIADDSDTSHQLAVFIAKLPCIHVRHANRKIREHRQMPRGTVFRLHFAKPLTRTNRATTRWLFPSRNVGVPATFVQTVITPAICPHGCAAAKANVFTAHHCGLLRSGDNGRTPMVITSSSATILAPTCRLHRCSKHTHWSRESTDLALRVPTLKAPRGLAATAATRTFARTDFTPRHRATTTP